MKWSLDQRFKSNLDVAVKAVMAPFSTNLFEGMQAFFLPDMGLMVAWNFSSGRKKSPALIACAVVAPLVHAAITLVLSMLLRLLDADGALR